MYLKRVKELELEVQRLRNELEDERAKRSDAESALKLDQVKTSQVEGLNKTIERQVCQMKEMKREKEVLEAIIEKFRQDNSKTANMYFEKDAEIEYLQKEISQIMKEKADKETIIKSNFTFLMDYYSSFLGKHENFSPVPRPAEPGADGGHPRPGARLPQGAARGVQRPLGRARAAPAADAAGLRRGPGQPRAPRRAAEGPASPTQGAGAGARPRGRAPQRPAAHQPRVPACQGRPSR